MNLNCEMRQNIQRELDFSSTPTGESRKAGEEENESLEARHAPKSPARSDRLMEEIVDRENLKEALRRVKANKGSPGVDGHNCRLCAGKCKTSHLTWYLAFNAFARRRRRRCGNVGTRVLCGFPSFEGDMLFTDQRTHFAPSKRHFHSGPSLLACFVRFSIVNCLKNRLPLLQKPASNDVFYTFLRRALSTNAD
jgi:hypothetical protein